MGVFLRSHIYDSQQFILLIVNINMSHASAPRATHSALCVAEASAMGSCSDIVIRPIQQ